MITELDRYCRRTGMAPTYVCLLSVGRSNLYYALIRGTVPTDATVEKVRSFMDANPHGVPEKPKGKASHHRIGDMTVTDRFAELLAETGDITASAEAIGITRDYAKMLFKRIRKSLGPQAI